MATNFRANKLYLPCSKVELGSRRNESFMHKGVNGFLTNDNEIVSLLTVCDCMCVARTLAVASLVPRPSPQLLSHAIRKAGAWERG